MELLKEKIQIFNDIQVLGNPRWLTSAEKREGKLYSSISFAVGSEEEKKSILRARLLVAGISAETATFRDFAPNSPLNARNSGILQRTALRPQSADSVQKNTTQKTTTALPVK